MSRPLFQLSHIGKTFGGVSALGDVSFDVMSGEVHALVGENGAGKSTLINIANGLLRPDAGELILEGRHVHFHNPHQAAWAGVHVVHQEAELFPQLSVAENMLLGQGLRRNRLGLIRWRATFQHAQQLLAAVGERFGVEDDAAELPVARRTMSEIAAAVAQSPKVLFLDEPTASLSQQEIANLFAQIGRVKASGAGVIYVSHRLEEVLQIADRVTVLRDGHTVATHSVEDLTVEVLVSEMVGRNLTLDASYRRNTPGQVCLQVQHLTDARKAFQDVSFTVRAGEILGVYGFIGAGRSECAQALFGLRKTVAGSVRLAGKPFEPASPRAALRAGVAYLPEDRLVQGIFRGHSLGSNATIATLRHYARLGIVVGRREQLAVRELVEAMKVRAIAPEQPIGTLSGGNQQKVVLGRWLAAKPRVLLLDEPTRGVDVGAKAEIHRLIGELAGKGAAIVLISSELPEIMAMSDRVITLSEGQVAGLFDPKVDGQEAIARAAVPRSSGDRGSSTSRPRAAFARALQMRELGLLLFIFLLSGVMTVVRPGEFATLSNAFDILANAALPAILAQGAMLVICSGAIDISIGSMLGLIAAVTASAAKTGLSPLLCLGLAVTMGTFFGVLNGGAALLARIHPIIITLAGLSIYRGVMRIAMGGSDVMDLPADFRALADGRLFGIPVVCYYVLIVTLLVHWFLRYTLKGRQVLALGNSERAALLIGLSKARLTLLVFGISGALVGIASVLYAGYYGNVQAHAGTGMELQAIAAAVIGGANVLGGRGSALGTLLGAFLVSMLYNTLILLEASSYWQNIFVGGLILVAVVLDALVRRLRGGART